MKIFLTSICMNPMLWAQHVVCWYTMLLLIHYVVSDTEPGIKPRTSFLLVLSPLSVWPLWLTAIILLEMNTRLTSHNQDLQEDFQDFRALPIMASISVGSHLLLRPSPMLGGAFNFLSCLYFQAWGALMYKIHHSRYNTSAQITFGTEDWTLIRLAFDPMVSIWAMFFTLSHFVGKWLICHHIDNHNSGQLIMADVWRALIILECLPPVTSVERVCVHVCVSI